MGASPLPAAVVRRVPAPTIVSEEPRPPDETARPARSMLATDVATAMVLMALGWLVLVASVRMGIGWGSDGPESGFVPFWLSTVLIGCSAIVTVQALRRGSRRRFASREQLRRVLTVVLPALAMILLVMPLGLYVASALYMGFYMRWGGRHSWASSIALPLAFVVLVFVVFERWFLVPLPKGPLEAWLGY